MFLIIVLFEINSWPVGSSISGLVLGFSLPSLWKSIQDLTDTTEWKTSQRKLKRGDFIKDDTIIRISFAYLYRIKIGDKYLLVKNERGTGKDQPVGGVYKLFGNEKIELKNRYKVKDDNKISSKNETIMYSNSGFVSNVLLLFGGILLLCYFCVQGAIYLVK